MRCSKLLVLGLAAIISCNALAASNQAEQSIAQLTEQVQMLQQNNIIPKVDINYFIKSAEEMPKETSSLAHANIDIANENCTITIHTTPDMKVLYTGTKANKEFLKEVTGATNQAQEAMRMEFVTYHEAAHCRLYEIKDPFRAEDKNAQEALNKFFLFSQSGYASDHYNVGMYEILHENFADISSFIRLVKTHGVGKDVMEVMQRIQNERFDASNVITNSSLIHSSEFSIKEFLKEENIKKVMATDNPQELEEIALQIANKGMWTSIKTYNNAAQVITSESLEDGAKALLRGLIMKNVESQAKLEKNVNLNLEDNIIYKVALQTQQRLARKVDFSEIKTEEQVDKLFEEYKSSIDILLSARVNNQLKESKENGLDVLGTLNSYYSTITPDAKQSVEEIKTNGAEALKSIEKLSEKLSKDSALKNMYSIRQSSSGNIANKVHIKYNS